MRYTETHGARALFVRNSILSILVPISSQLDKNSDSAFKNSDLGVGSMPATKSGGLDYSFVSNFVNFEDILIIFVPISMYLKPVNMMEVLISYFIFKIRLKLGKYSFFGSCNL